MKKQKPSSITVARDFKRGLSFNGLARKHGMTKLQAEQAVRESTNLQAIRCVADNPGQTIDLYEDGRVRLHANGRTIVYRCSQSHAEAIELIVFTLNLLAAGRVGQPCKVCKRKK